MNGNGIDKAEIEFCARAAHEVNRAFCDVLAGGEDPTQLPWWAAPEWAKQSARNGVIGVLVHDYTPEQSHQSWMEEKLAAGWKWGPTKDPDKKEHPCIVAYADLPIEQQAKDYLYIAVVKAASRAYQRRPQ